MSCFIQYGDVFPSEKQPGTAAAFNQALQIKYWLPSSSITLEQHYSSIDCVYILELIFNANGENNALLAIYWSGTSLDDGNIGYGSTQYSKRADSTAAQTTDQESGHGGIGQEAVF
jgi:hypothetical protein